ncbi:MAG TPA: hypothetical protein VNN09_09390 [Candidatus Competibacteraceae bacterium]|nr:hypothetical protein [Candidatus Competibacteraceae bacterium]
MNKKLKIIATSAMAVGAVTLVGVSNVLAQSARSNVIDRGLVAPAQEDGDAAWNAAVSAFCAAQADSTSGALMQRVTDTVALARFDALCNGALVPTGD